MLEDNYCSLICGRRVVCTFGSWTHCAKTARTGKSCLKAFTVGGTCTASDAQLLLRCALEVCGGVLVWQNSHIKM